MSPPSPPPQQSRRTAWLRGFVDFREGEGWALLLSFLYFFTLLCGYSILKPLRDEMGIAGNVNKLKWMFTGTFVAMLVAVPLFSALVSRYPRRRVLPFVYRFFLLNLLVFFVLLKLQVGAVYVARAFFIWASVYNLFVVSVFWSFMADLFSREQGKRLFGFIAAGGTVGTLVGPLATTLLVKPLGPVNLLLLSAGLLEASAWCVQRLSRWARTHEPLTPAANDAPVGGGIFAGFKQVVHSPYLLGLGAQTLLYAATSTLLYFVQAQIVSASATDAAHRTQLFATLDLATNVLTLLLQVVVTGRLMHRLGLAVTLGIIPVVTAAGFVGLAALPALGLLTAFRAARGATHYAFERPAREVLFTVVDREEKYKSKSFIDTVVYRGSDAASSFLADALKGLGPAGVAVAAVPLAAAWLAVSLSLARGQEARARAHAATTALAAPPLTAERAS